MSSFARRFGLVALLVASSFAIAPSSQGATAKACTLTITGQAESGELLTGPMQCTTGAAAPAAALLGGYIAVHYTGFNFTGSTLSIVGDVCNGGWLNLPTSWRNVIRSTSSSCVVSHYDLNFLVGDVQATFSPGGNLSYMADRTNSLQYT